MRFPSLAGYLAALAVASAQTTGKLGDAPVVTSSSTGVKYRAVIDSAEIHGSVTALAVAVGINYTIGLHQLPTEKGPFSTSWQT